MKQTKELKKIFSFADTNAEVFHNISKGEEQPEWNKSDTAIYAHEILNAIAEMIFDFIEQEENKIIENGRNDICNYYVDEYRDECCDMCILAGFCDNLENPKLKTLVKNWNAAYPHKSLASFKSFEKANKDIW